MTLLITLTKKAIDWIEMKRNPDWKLALYDKLKESHGYENVLDVKKTAKEFDKSNTSRLEKKFEEFF